MYSAIGLAQLSFYSLNNKFQQLLAMATLTKLAGYNYTCVR